MTIKVLDEPKKNLLRGADTVAIAGDPDDLWHAVKVIDTHPYSQQYAFKDDTYPVMIEIGDLRYSIAEARQLIQSLMEATDYADALLR